MKKIKLFGLLSLLMIQVMISQEGETLEVFKDEAINFNGEGGKTSHIERLQSGRIILKKVTVKDFPKGTDVFLKLTVRSDGDRWDKSGSCFVISDLDAISIADVSRGVKSFPAESIIGDKFGGVKSTDTYKPVTELLRFMTPFGVGHFSKENDSHRRPVYVPKWEEEVVWESDVSNLLSLIEGSFYIGVWIDTWTPEGYKVDLSLNYTDRPKKTVKVMPLVNTIPYVSGQSLPDFFADVALEQGFSFDKNVKNVKLHYITTGHGGHSGGDEFVKIKNNIWIDNELVLDIFPWRDDCASFRRFNPTSGVWLRKDSASYIDFEAKKYMVKQIEERIASSDLSRSNWCPGSKVEPIVIDLGDMPSGEHQLKIGIDGTKAGENKYNHWLVSAYLTYEE